MSKRAIADLLIKIGADNYEFQQKIAQTQNQLGKMSKQLTEVGKSLSLKLTAPILAFGGFSLKAFDDSAKAAAKVEQGVKSTGGAAKLSFAELSQFAGALQGKTLFEDDFILNNATAQLLTFTNIAGDNFKRTQAVALDLATVLDGDLKSASIQLGKALNDPVKNLSALSRSGIQFSKEQKAVINTLAETGRLAQAQAVILDELERQYGGQAEAAAKVGLGSLTQLKNLWGDFMEQIGAVMLPMTNKLIGALRGLVEWLMQLSPTTKQVIVVVAGLAAALGPALLAIGSIVKLLPLIKAGFVTLLNPIVLAVTAVLMLVAALAKLNGKSDEFVAQRMGKGIWTVENIDQAEADYDKQVQIVDDLNAKQKALLALRDTKAYRGKEYTKISFELRPLREELTAHENLLKAKYKLLSTLREEKQALAGGADSLLKQAAAAGLSAEEVEKLLASIGKAGKATGLIAKLGEELSRLEKEKENATTVEEIAGLNTQIDALKKQLDGLREVTSEYLALRAKMEQTPSIGGVSLAAPKIEVKQANPLETYAEQFAERIKKAFEKLSEVFHMYGGEYLTNKYSEIAEAFNKRGRVFALKMAESVIAIVDFVKQSVGGIIEGVFGSIFTGMTDLLSGSNIGEVLGNVLNSVTSMLGDFVIQMAIKLMMASQVMIAFKEAVEKFILANPYVALAIAAGMLATGLLLKNTLQNNAQGSVPKLANGGLAYGPTYAMVGDNVGARVDPEVIAPLSKLKALLPNGGGQNIALTISGELKAKGADLALAMSRNNFRTKIVNG